MNLLRTLRPFGFVTLVFSGVACSSLPAASSPIVGCNEDDIEISHEQHGPSGDTWTATCHGHVWDCARDEKEVEGSGWGTTTSVSAMSLQTSPLQYQTFRGTVSGDTYCIRREDG